MGFIYKIANDINDKVYIGQTKRTIEKRFQEHCQQSFQENFSVYPLHRAIKKYGKEHFNIALIEEIEDSSLNEREIFWINYYNSYLKGYNATAGGEGGGTITKDDIEKMKILWQEGKTLEQIGKVLNKWSGTIRFYLEKEGITEEEFKKRQYDSHKKNVYQFDITTKKLLNVFSSLTEAQEKTRVDIREISACCYDKRMSVGGYIFLLENNKDKLEEHVERIKSPMRKNTRKKIYQYNLDYTLVKEWSYAKELYDETGYDKSSIQRRLYKQVTTPYKNFYWSYEKLDFK